MGYKKDNERKNNVCCAHSLLQRINKKIQVHVNVCSLSDPPEPIFLTESHTALLGQHIQSKSKVVGKKIRITPLLSARGGI